MADTEIEDKILGATYGFVLACAISSEISPQYLAYKKYIKPKLNFDHLSNASQFLDFYTLLARSNGYFGYENPTTSGIPLNGLIGRILQQSDSFKNILPKVIAYSLLNLKSDHTKVFSDLNLLVYRDVFSDELLCVSFAIHLILQELLNCPPHLKEKVFDDVKGAIFRQLKGLTIHNDIFYYIVSDRELYKLAKETNIWNSVLVSFCVLKSANDYLEGVKKIILFGGNIDINIQLFGLFYGALYGSSGMPAEYIPQINNRFSIPSLFQKNPEVDTNTYLHNLPDTNFVV